MSAYDLETLIGWALIALAVIGLGIGILVPLLACILPLGGKR